MSQINLTQQFKIIDVARFIFINEMENYNNDIIRKLFEVFSKLDIDPEDFIKHIDEDDYVDKETFIRVFFEYILYRAHLDEYVDVIFKERSEQSEEAENSEEAEVVIVSDGDGHISIKDDGGNLFGKVDVDTVFANEMIYAISKDIIKFNDVIVRFIGGVEEAFSNDEGKLTGGAEKRLIDQLYFYTLM